jgi:hypothetical protein
MPPILHIGCSAVAICLLLCATPLLSLAACSGSDVTDNSASQHRPDPRYSPREVVGLAFEALAHKDVPYRDAGIRTVFCFASPANKRITGPFARFALMLHRHAFGPMLHHAEAEYRPIQLRAVRVRQAVVLTARSGQPVGYRFELSRQMEPPFQGARMADSVMRFEGVMPSQQARADTQVRM